MTEDNRTQSARPLPKRLKLGWQAWEATVGYIAQEHALDATLTVSLYPSEGIVTWAATLTWGENQESIEDCVSLPFALNELWQKVVVRHVIFKTLESASRQPIGYTDDQWLDEPTEAILSRLVGVTATIFQEDWRLLLIYRPVETPEDRVHIRLIARQDTVLWGGKGITLRDACRNLYINATPVFKHYMTQEE